MISDENLEAIVIRAIEDAANRAVNLMEESLVNGMEVEVDITIKKIRN